LRIDVYSIFPGIFESPLKESLLGKAIEARVIDIRPHDIRDYTEGKHRQVDDEPFGGGPGMVMKPEPIFRAVTETLGYGMNQLDELKSNVEVILLTPGGEKLDQEKVSELSRREHLALICGRYEGVDERVREHLCTRALSIGDYILSGGEFAALVVIDSVARLLPGVVGNQDSLTEESFSQGLLEYPQYTRPADFNGWKVPEIILSGNHGEIEKWRRMAAEESTRKTRPELAHSEPDEV
jgi:tRNA (guanine37-N1)-methyltransferase